MVSECWRRGALSRFGTLVGVGILTAACSGADGKTGPAEDSARLVSISIAPAAATLLRGQTATFVLDGRDASGRAVTVTGATWESSVPSVATVASGVVTAVSDGVTTIIARTGSLSASASVSVRTPPRYAVRVHLDSGVTGSPGAGEQAIDSGSSIAFEYSARQGFENARVFVDTLRVGLSGRVVVSSAITFVASAERLPATSATANALSAPTLGLLTAPDAGAAMRSISDAYRTYLSNADTGRANEIRAIRRRAFRDVPQSQLTAFYKRLGDRNVLRSQAGAGSSASASSGPHVFYVNGILADPGDAAQSAAEVASLAAGFGYSSSLFYNPNWYAETTTWFNCLSRNASVFNWRTYADIILCSKFIRDAAEAQAQIELIMQGVSGTHPFVTEVRDALKTYIDAGRTVVLVAHSQGNLMVQEALAQLLLTTPPAFQAAVSRCVGVVSIAAPLSETFPAGYRIDGTIAAGLLARDILLWYPNKNRFPTISSSATALADVGVVSLTGVLNLPITIGAFGVYLHGMDTYLSASETRSWISGRIGQVGSAISSGCADVIVANPTSIAVSVGQSADLAAELHRATGTRVTGANLSWSSSNPAIARVVTTPRPQVIGNSVGTARIEVRSGTAVTYIDVAVGGAAGGILAASGVGSSSAPSDLWLVPSSASGTDVFLGRIRTAQGIEPVISDIARAPDGTIWGTSFDALWTIDAATAKATLFGSYVGLTGVNALASDAAGRLYFAANISDVGVFGMVDPATRVLNVIGNLGAGLTSAGDLAFAPDGTLYGSALLPTGEGVLVRVDSHTGAATRVGTATFSQFSVWGLAFVGSTLFGLTADAGTGRGQLVTIDTVTGASRALRSLSFSAFGAGARLSPEKR